jgi:RNA polymerase sigma-70 factor (ECF subfamily)
MKTTEQTIPLAFTGEAMDDRSLLARAKSGEERAFEELMRLHQRAVLGLCQRMLGTNGEAEEAAQDAFFRLYRTLGQLDEDRRVEPWLFRIAFNGCRDRLRRRKVQVELDEQVGADAPAAETMVVLREVRERLRYLTGSERAVLLLREVEGLAMEEIAARMNHSPGTVRSHLSRAKAKLRQWLGGKR